jgi:hypothetical protein
MANRPTALGRLPKTPGIPDEVDIRSGPAQRPMNSNDDVTITSRSRRRPATRSALQVLTVCAAAETASTSASSEINRAPARARLGQMVQPSDTANAMQTTISNKAACHRRRTKSSSNVARTQSQTKTGLPARIGKVHHSVDFGTNGAVAIR